MTNKDLWQSYQDYTKNLTENARKLGFASAAICWLFKSTGNTFPPLILNALGFVVLFFLSDVLQYLLGAVCLRCWTRREEKRRWQQTQSIDGEYDKPAWLDYPSYTMWWVKILSLAISFLLIGLHVIRTNPG